MLSAPAPVLAPRPARAPRLELADIVRAHGAVYRQTHVLTRGQGRALRAIAQCRTAALGGHRAVCMGLTIAPGKHSSSKHRSGHWARDLDTDLAVLVGEYQANVLVCLLEDEDLRRLQIPNLVERAEAHGLEVIRFPVTDVSVPRDDSAVYGLVQDIRAQSEAGRNVVIHCEGGLGRTGTIAGCYLVLFGQQADEIFERLVSTRGQNCPETEPQRSFIRQFAKKIGRYC